MTAYRALLTLGTLAMSLGVGNTAKADTDIALSFALPPAPQQKAAEAAAIEMAAQAPPELAPSPQTLMSAEAPLPIPPGAENPPMASNHTRPAGVYGGLDAVAIGAVPSVHSLLPPPPPIPDYLQPVVTAIAPPPSPEAPLQEFAQRSEAAIKEPVALLFGIEKPDVAPEAADTDTASEVSEAVPLASLASSWNNLTSVFEGGTDSLVAWAVGSAEGTRTPEGHKNPAYFGHVDPGNGVWNMGTFSYQHGASTPEEADEKQLRRLQSQTKQLQQQAHDKGLDLSQEELLNGIDLANQAPLAALDRGGYLDWLKEARQLGMTGSEAIVWARTRSFIDPDTQRWNAPGLGNNVYSISHDQERRANAISRAISAFTAKVQIAATPTAESLFVASEPPTEAIVAAIDEVPFKLNEFSREVLPTNDQEIIAASTPAESASPEISEPIADELTIEVDDLSLAAVEPLTGVPLVAESLEPHAAAAAIAPSQPGRPLFNWLNKTLAKIASPPALPLSTEELPATMSRATSPQQTETENVESIDVDAANPSDLSKESEALTKPKAIASNQAIMDESAVESQLTGQSAHDTADPIDLAAIAIAASDAGTTDNGTLMNLDESLENTDLETAAATTVKSPAATIAAAFAKPQILRPTDNPDSAVSDVLAAAGTTETLAAPSLLPTSEIAMPTDPLTFDDSEEDATALADKSLPASATDETNEASAIMTDAKSKRTALAALDRLQETLRQAELAPNP